MISHREIFWRKKKWAALLIIKLFLKKEIVLLPILVICDNIVRLGKLG